jgi:hypothetical protein
MHGSDPQIVRSAMDVQKAHDFLHACCFEKSLPLAISKKDRKLMKASMNVLCWLLGHEHNQDFNVTLAAMEEAFKKAGVECTVLPTAMTPEERARWEAEQN